MKRENLEHVISAACAVTGEDEVYVLGSQALLGTHPDAPYVLTHSMGADLIILGKPDMASLIDGSLGEFSHFHNRFGYFAKGAADRTSKLPDGWKARLVRVQGANVSLSVGFCLHPIDLAASKLAAHREKDLDFVNLMLSHGIIELKSLRSACLSLPIEAEVMNSVLGWVDARLGSENEGHDETRVDAHKGTGSGDPK